MDLQFLVSGKINITRDIQKALLGINIMAVMARLGIMILQMHLIAIEVSLVNRSAVLKQKLDI